MLQSAVVAAAGSLPGCPPIPTRWVQPLHLMPRKPAMPPRAPRSRGMAGHGPGCSVRLDSWGQAQVPPVGGQQGQGCDRHPQPRPGAGAGADMESWREPRAAGDAGALRAHAYGTAPCPQLLPPSSGRSTLSKREWAVTRCCSWHFWPSERGRSSLCLHLHSALSGRSGRTAGLVPPVLV